MKNIFTVLFLVLIVCSTQSCSQNAETPIQALLITGGGWHDYEVQEVLVTEGISERVTRPIEWTIVHEGDKEPDYHVSVLQEDNWTDGYDIIVHNTGFGRVTDADFVAQFTEYHKGTPAVLIHSSIQSYRYAEPADPWFEFTGVQSMWHEDQRIFEVETIDSAHSIMQGIPERWTTPNEELYVVEKVWGDITPLAQSYGVETEEYHTVAWTHEVNGARVFATTLGHNNEMHEREEFQNMIANGFRWAVENPGEE